MFEKACQLKIKDTRPRIVSKLYSVQYCDHNTIVYTYIEQQCVMNDGFSSASRPVSVSFCIQETAHYCEIPNPDPDSNQPLHLVDQIHITAVSNLQQCISISENVLSL